MPGLFQTIEIGRRALLSHQLALQTIGHNIANVNTPGYTRQRVNLTATNPEDSYSGKIGTGVTVTDINHVRDLFLGEQLRQETKSYGQWSYKEKIMSQVETIFSEPNDNSLSDLLNRFWDSWGDLSTSPDSVSDRVAVVENTKLLTNSFHQLSNQLDALTDSVDTEIVNTTSQINKLTEEIARLNDQIKVQEAGSSKANDLRDARDKIIDDLSQIIDVNSIEQANGTATVYIGAMTVVDGAEFLKIGTKELNKNGQVKHDLFWAGSNVQLKNLNGQLAGMIETRDKIIPKYIQQLDDLAKTLVEQVNQVHATGYGLNSTTGVNFFDTQYTNAANISINNELVLDPAKVAASASGEPGDNRVALDLLNMRNAKIMLNNTSSINDTYGGLVGQLGIESNTASSFTKNYELLINQIENSKQSVEGVSLDEEMTNLIKFQHSYDAAARIITAMDEALDTVVVRMGIVGR